MIKIKSVDLLLTFKCPCECRHCSYHGGPSRTGMMSPDQAKKWLRELKDLGDLQGVTLHGGEPFIDFELLLEIVSYANSLDLTGIGVITNAFWATTRERASAKLEELMNAGLTQVTFSLDAFHQEFIPLERVQNGVASASSMGFAHVWVDSYFISGVDIDNPHNLTTRKAIGSLKHIDGVEFSSYVAGLEGRAADCLPEQVESDVGIPKGPCVSPFWIPGGLQSPTTIEIDYEGNVTLCPGLCIGNAVRDSLTDIVRSYDYQKHPIISRIVEEGPVGLIELSKKHGLAHLGAYQNECHLCYEMRRFLQPFYPEQLAPLGCYRDTHSKQ